MSEAGLREWAVKKTRQKAPAAHVTGFDDPSMGWARYAQAVKHFNLNSGLFYVKANDRTIDLMTRLAIRLDKEKYWVRGADC